MSQNPFNNTLDWALQGKYARVHTDHGTFEGWVERVHHGRGSVVMHDCTETTDDEQLGSVFIRTPEVVTVLKPRKQIEWRRLDALTAHPDHDGAFTPNDEMIRSCYRDAYAGSFPVVRRDGTIINGHKRIAAARVAGLERHPVEVIDITDEQANELFRVAHRAEGASDDSEGDEGTDTLADRM